MKRLDEKLVKWRKDVGAKSPVPNPQFDPNRPVNERPQAKEKKAA